MKDLIGSIFRYDFFDELGEIYVVLDGFDNQSANSHLAVVLWYDGEISVIPIHVIGIDDTQLA